VKHRVLAVVAAQVESDTPESAASTLLSWLDRKLPAATAVPGAVGEITLFPMEPFLQEAFVAGVKEGARKTQARSTLATLEGQTGAAPGKAQ